MTDINERINDLDSHLTADELAQKELLVEQAETEGIKSYTRMVDERIAEQAEASAMASKLSPLRGVHGAKSASPLHLKPVAATRPTFQTVNDALAQLIQRLTEINSEAYDLRQRLTGNVGKGPQEHVSGPSDGGSIFDFLAHQSLMLARLVAELEETVKECQESVK